MTFPRRARTATASLVFALLLLAAGPAAAKPEGLVEIETGYTYQQMIDRLNTAVQNNKMGLVTRASATVGAKKAFDKDIPGNMVVGVYHPRFAVRMLEASIPAGIEAPIRFYITEQADGTAKLWYRKPSAVFAPYDGGQALIDMAAELDEIFAKIATEAAGK